MQATPEKLSPKGKRYANGVIALTAAGLVDKGLNAAD